MLTLATPRKFHLKCLLRETGTPDDEAEADLDDTGSDTISTVITSGNKLSELVAGLLCPSCRSNILCQLQMYCTSCEDSINSTHSSDQIGGNAGQLPFVVTHAVVSASLDMGVGHSGIVELCRFLDMNTLSQTTFAIHSRAIVEVGMVLANNILTDAAKIVRRVYADQSTTTSAAASDADVEVIDLTVSFDGSWMKRSHTSAYGIGCYRHRDRTCP